jgi:hypothetical protein
MRFARRFETALLGVSLGTLVIAGAAPAQYAKKATQTTMRELFTQIQFLLPLSVDDDFGDPARRDEIRVALMALADGASQLDDHSRGFDPGAQNLGRGLTGDARRTLELYDQGAYDAAAFYLQHLTESCVGCHSQLSSDDSPLAKGFLQQEQLQRLDLLERARLQIATRQFDAALDSFESAFASGSVHPGTLIGPLVDYLTICVRVRHELDRARATLAKFAARPEIWKQLRRDLEEWMAALGRYREADLERAQLAPARRIIEAARAETRYPGDLGALIDYLVASAQLHRFVALHRGPPAELAEAYYLLGTAELAIGRDFWISKAASLLETSIRTAPDTLWAQRAFALLEQETLAGYSGSAGLRLPEDERVHLEALRALVDAEERPAAGR